MISALCFLSLLTFQEPDATPSPGATDALQVPEATAPAVNEAASTEGAPPAEVPPPKPPPYSLPFALRPVVVGNVVRLDGTLAMAKPATTVPIMLLASYKLTDELAALVRLGAVQSSPEGADGAFGLMNPVVAGAYALKLDDLRLNFFLGMTVPVGSGGGDTPDAAARGALLSGILARSAMDNAMFAMNYLTIFPGAGIAYVKSGLTAQAEATVLVLNRVRGEAKDADALRVNLTSGLHLGYFLMPTLSLAIELRYQRWLSNPTVTKVADNPSVDNLTLAVGPRVHLDLGGGKWIRPAIVFAFGLDAPMGFGDTGAAYKILQLDVPFSY